VLVVLVVVAVEELEVQDQLRLMDPLEEQEVQVLVVGQEIVQ
jgi:hypothetical protein